MSWNSQYFWTYLIQYRFKNDSGLHFIISFNPHLFSAIFGNFLSCLENLMPQKSFRHAVLPFLGAPNLLMWSYLILFRLTSHSTSRPLISLYFDPFLNNFWPCLENLIGRGSFSLHFVKQETVGVYEILMLSYSCRFMICLYKAGCITF